MTDRGPPLPNVTDRGPLPYVTDRGPPLLYVTDRGPLPYVTHRGPPLPYVTDRTPPCHKRPTGDPPCHIIYNIYDPWGTGDHKFDFVHISDCSKYVVSLFLVQVLFCEDFPVNMIYDMI